jgi:cytochrome b561
MLFVAHGLLSMSKETVDRYGLIARLLHWGMAVLLTALFVLGWWATELSYYDPLYRIVPDLHRSLGVLAAVLIVLRLIWSLIDRKPAVLADGKRWERVMAKAGHWVLYALMVLVPISGYLLSTADGRGVDVFGLFELPALLPASSGREEWAGLAHYLLGFGGAYLVLIHAAAALKHQFIDRDGTLRKMIW